MPVPFTGLKQGAKMLIFPEGYGLQAVRKRFAISSALAAEGRITLQAPLFSQVVQQNNRLPADRYNH
jgi:hypothetical protein